MMLVRSNTNSGGIVKGKDYKVIKVLESHNAKWFLIKDDLDREVYYSVTQFYKKSEMREFIIYDILN